MLINQLQLHVYLFIINSYNKFDRCILYFEVNFCETGGTNTQLPNNAGRYLNIFPNMTFPCEGSLSSWTIYTPTANTGIVYLGVWQEIIHFWYRLMGVNTVQIIGAGLHTYTIPEADRIRVNTSNFIGIHFPDPGVSGLVSYSADTSHYCFNTNVRHGAIQNNGRVLDNTVYGRYDYIHRTASIRARVDSG